MTSDLKLTDEAVIVVGNLGVGTDTPQRAIHAEAGEIHSGGGAGGFSFSNRTKGAGNFFPNSNTGDRWLLYSQGAFAHLWTSGPLGGNIFSLSSTGQAFVTGITAGLSFGDRSIPHKFVESPTKGERWIWYAKDGVAHLRSGADHISIQANGHVSIGLAKAERPLHVEGDEIHSSGTGAGFSFADRSATKFVGDPQKGERWVWYSSEGSARLWSGGDRIAIQPNGYVSIGLAKAERTLHVEGDGIHASGSGAALSFADRTIEQFVVSPKKGERWLWYCSGGSARLWSGADKIAISPKGDLTIGSGAPGKSYTTITPGKVVLGTGKTIHQEVLAPGRGAPKTFIDFPEEFDLLQMLTALRTEIDKLKAQVATLKSKP